MKTSLSYLPKIKQEQVLHAVEIIRREANPEMIILFGSYAKDSYIEHKYMGGDGIFYEYESDYDFLVVTKNNPSKTYEIDQKISSKVPNNYPELNIEIHEIDYINEGLEFGQYFFSDIVKEGVLLYDTHKVQFAQPKELTSTEKKEIAQRYYDIWFPKGCDFLDSIDFFIAKDSLKIAAFMAHQTAECYYYTTLLVFTGYKPKTHNLKKLRKQSKVHSEELFLLFPIENDKNEKHLFDLLKRGYIDARYRIDYSISIEELKLIQRHLKAMQSIVEKICSEQIRSITKI